MVDQRKRSVSNSNLDLLKPEPNQASRLQSNAVLSKTENSRLERKLSRVGYRGCLSKYVLVYRQVIQSRVEIPNMQAIRSKGCAQTRQSSRVVRIGISSPQGSVGL